MSHSISKDLSHKAFSLFLLIAGLLAWIPARAEKGSLPRTLNEVITDLDEAIADNHKYITTRQHAIDTLKSKLRKASREDSLSVITDLISGYDRYQLDSCLVYMQRGANVARHQGDTITAQQLTFDRFARLPLLGIPREGVDNYERMRPYILKENKLSFYEAGYFMMQFTAELYPNAPIREAYIKGSLQYGDSLISMLPSHSPLRLLAEAHKAKINKDFTTLVASLSEILDSTDLDSPYFSQAALQLGQYYQDRKALSQAAYYYALSSISDVHTASLDGSGMLHLGTLLYDMGDTDRAFKYINIALERIGASGTKVRAVEALESLPKVSKAFTNQDAKRFIWMGVLTLCLLVTLVMMGSVLFKLHRQMNSMRKMQSLLADANVAKEKNISRFIEMASMYADKLEEFTRLATRKITTGQIEDLHRILKSGSVTQDQTKMFCQMFDNAFQHLYPTFVKDVNTLLLPDKQIMVESNGQLNAELRILAFLRLGIDDTTRISRFLGMSLNTVYTYRNRLRAKAIKRDTFEADIMNIGSVDELTGLIDTK